jgi:hypothetical protein
MIVFVVPYVKSIRLGGAVVERRTTGDTGNTGENPPRRTRTVLEAGRGMGCGTLPFRSRQYEVHGPPVALTQ